VLSYSNGAYVALATLREAQSRARQTGTMGHLVDTLRTDTVDRMAESPWISEKPVTTELAAEVGDDDGV